MTTRTLSSYAAAGYSLLPGDDELDITATGGVGGTGVYSNHVATIMNAGRINETTGAEGIYLAAGGSVINQQTGFIFGTSYGVLATGSAGVINYGTIRANSVAVSLHEGGSLDNGSYTDLGALIEGYTAASFKNASGDLTNFATISGGVYMGAGGQVTNGAIGDTTASIVGGQGMDLKGGVSTVANFGTIQAFARAGFVGVRLESGGTVVNGGVTDTKAVIEGHTAVEVYGPATVSNFGLIDGTGAAAGALGVLFHNGGRLTNGAATDRTALIEGYSGVTVLGAAGTVVNSGTIEALGVSASENGLFLAAGGAVTNGSLNNADALIEGYNGLRLSGTATATNFGTISGVGDAGGNGALLTGGQSLTNGAAGHARALIEGFRGVRASGAGATVTNFGTIMGAGGTAVLFASSTDVLVVEAGSRFVGAVLGGGGSLDLDTGTGTLTGLLAAGAVTVSGSMAATTFQNFNTVEIGAAAIFATSGAVTIAAGQTLIDAGLLTLGGTKAGVANAGTIETLGGTLTVKGAVTGAGQAAINGGTLDFTSSFNQNVTFSGTTGVLELAQSQTYTATVAGFSRSGGTSLDLADIAFVSASEATFVGTRTGGVLTVTDGTHTAHITLVGNYLRSAFVAASDGHGGTIVHDPRATAAPPHAFIAAMAGLGTGGGGAVHSGAEAWRSAPTMLARPRMAQA